MRHRPWPESSAWNHSSIVPHPGDLSAQIETRFLAFVGPVSRQHKVLSIVHLVLCSRRLVSQLLPHALIPNRAVRSGERLRVNQTKAVLGEFTTLLVK